LHRLARFALDRLSTRQPKLEQVNIRVCISQPRGSFSSELRVGPRAPAGRPCDLDAGLRHVMLKDRQTASRSFPVAGAVILDFGALIDASPDVGWTDVYRAIELCRNAGLQRIAFTAPRFETQAPPGR
jgi:hypothetical protein